MRPAQCPRQSPRLFLSSSLRKYAQPALQTRSNNDLEAQRPRRHPSPIMGHSYISLPNSALTSNPETPSYGLSTLRAASRKTPRSSTAATPTLLQAQPLLGSRSHLFNPQPGFAEAHALARQRSPPRPWLQQLQLLRLRPMPVGRGA